MRLFFNSAQRLESVDFKIFNIIGLKEPFGGPVFLAVSIFTSIGMLMLFLGSDHGLLEFDKGLGELGIEDFAAFYRGGQLALEGNAALAYDYQHFASVFSESNEELLFLNPPQAFLFFEPLAHLPYPVARAVGIVLNSVAIIGLVYSLRLNLGITPYVLTVLSCGAYFSFSILQISPIFIFLLVFALINHRKMPLLSGVALAIATIKPQFGLLVPVFLISVRSWPVFAYAAFGTLFLFFLTLAVYGSSVWEAFFSSISAGGHSTQLWDAFAPMITISHSLGKLGASDTVKMAGQVLVMMCCTVLVWFSGRKLSVDRSLPVVVFAMCIASPSFILYDWLLVSVGLLLLLRCKPRWTVLLQVLGGIVGAAPLIQAALGFIDWETVRKFSAFVPLLMISVCGLMLRELTNGMPRIEGAKAAREFGAGFDSKPFTHSADFTS
ncbi:glycosyltransferase 87 family protein [Roseibium sp.]|uniref:glycosyltransferase 87 family protein n=1 Tax=Roseibium sp. TaxID=1936156 RepID=UPI003B524586